MKKLDCLSKVAFISLSLWRKVYKRESVACSMRVYSPKCWRGASKWPSKDKTRASLSLLSGSHLGRSAGMKDEAARFCMDLGVGWSRCTKGLPACLSVCVSSRKLSYYVKRAGCSLLRLYILHHPWKMRRRKPAKRRRKSRARIIIAGDKEEAAPSAGCRFAPQSDVPDENVARNYILCAIVSNSFRTVARRKSLFMSRRFLPRKLIEFERGAFCISRIWWKEAIFKNWCWRRIFVVNFSFLAHFNSTMTHGGKSFWICW